MSFFIKESYSDDARNTVFFNHLNVNGINPHGEIVELTYIVETLEDMG